MHFEGLLNSFKTDLPYVLFSYQYYEYSIDCKSRKIVYLDFLAGFLQENKRRAPYQISISIVMLTWIPFFI